MQIIATIKDKEIILANTNHIPDINEIIILLNDSGEKCYIVKSVKSYYLENKNYTSVFTCEKAVIILEEVMC